jgi:O-acetyl-ADP-ribose deacetylase (regulator of RNase III)
MEYIVHNIINAAELGMFDAICHQTNCFHLWNSGLAPQIKEKLAGPFEADVLTPAGNESKLGTVSIARCTAKCHQNKPTFLVFNCYGQYLNCSAGGTTDYTALTKSLTTVANSVPAGSRIGLPKIGCGAAKGDWSIVSKIISDVFKNHTVTICVLHSGEIPNVSLN